MSLQKGCDLGIPEWEEGLSSIVPYYLMRVTPPLVLYNQLPSTLVLKHPSLSLPLTLDPGDKCPLYKLQLHTNIIIDLQVCHSLILRNIIYILILSIL